MPSIFDTLSSQVQSAASGATANLKIPGASSFLAAASQPGAGPPTPSSVGSQVGTFLSTAAGNFLQNAPSKLLGNNKVSQLLGPFIQQQIGNFLTTVPTGDLAQLLNRPDPMFSFSWYVKMPLWGSAPTPTYSSATNNISALRAYNATFNNPPNTNSAGGLVQGVSTLAPMPIDVSWYVQDVDVPQPSIGTKPINRGGRNIYIPDFQDISTMSVQFYEDVAGSVSYYLENWKQLIRNDLGYYSELNKFMADIEIVTTNPAGSDMFSLTLKDAFPIDKSGLTFNSQTGLVVITQNFSVNDLIYKPITPFTNGLSPATFSSLLGGVPSALAQAVVQQGENTLSNSVNLSDIGI